VWREFRLYSISYQLTSPSNNDRALYSPCHRQWRYVTGTVPLDKILAGIYCLELTWVLGWYIYICMYRSTVIVLCYFMRFITKSVTTWSPFWYGESTNELTCRTASMQCFRARNCVCSKPCDLCTSSNARSTSPGSWNRRMIIGFNSGYWNENTHWVLSCIYTLNMLLVWRQLKECISLFTLSYLILILFIPVVKEPTFCARVRTHTQFFLLHM
jgi:hypothetical protein